jgi:hypothetical protein
MDKIHFTKEKDAEKAIGFSRAANEKSEKI